MHILLTLVATMLINDYTISLLFLLKRSCFEIFSLKFLWFLPLFKTQQIAAKRLHKIERRL